MIVIHKSELESELSEKKLEGLKRQMKTEEKNNQKSQFIIECLDK